MSYLSFNKLGATDPLVDEETLLNDNWDHIDTKLAALQGIGAFSNPETGQETLSAGRFRVWNGAAHRNPDDIDASWSAFTALPILAPVTVRTSFTPRWRDNTALRKIELFGGVTHTSGASWPRGSLIQISTNVTANNIPAAKLPIGGVHVQECAASLPSSEAATGYSKVSINGTNGAILKVELRFLGTDGGGNFLMLDGISWWY